MFVRRESFKQYVSRYPFTTFILAVNTILFILTFRESELSNAIYNIGAMTPWATEEWWRFASYAFLHADLRHFLFNMFFLLIMATPLEIILGRGRYIVLFLFTVAATSISVYVIGSQYGVGASGFGYGVIGFYIYLMVFVKGFLDRDSQRIALIFTVIGWVSTFIIPGISISGHLGGFVGGILFGLLFVRNRNNLRSWYGSV